MTTPWCAVRGSSARAEIDPIRMAFPTGYPGYSARAEIDPFATLSTVGDFTAPPPARRSTWCSSSPVQ